MSSPETPVELSLLTSEPLTWYDRAASWLADRCSPILLKECRQALKSRQFLWTFLLLLLATLFWSFFGLSLQLSDRTDSSGLNMLVGYLSILCVPLLLIVPFAAFRSLASELDGETIQLLSITTMTPRQIINGKLVSSLLQILLYLSVLVPCIAFTYLLRGVDLSEVFWLIGFQISGSIALCSLCIMSAGLTKFASGRWVIAVGLIFLLLICTLSWFSFQGEALTDGLLSTNKEAWQGLLLIFLVVASTGWVCYSTATALISFPADDRSSRIRTALFLQHLVLVGGIVGYFLQMRNPARDDSLALIMPLTVVSCHYWLMFGSLICSENPGMSERVRRELPKSIIGQAFRGLLMPGPGRGYLFVLMQILGWSTVFWLWVVWSDYQKHQTIDLGLASVTGFLIITNAAHAILYLSLGWLVLGWIRGKRRLSPLAGLLTMLFVFGLINVSSFSLHSFVTADPRSGFDESYSVLLCGNWWYWCSRAELGGGGIMAIDEILATNSVIVLIATSVLMFFICIPRASRELVAPPGTVPERVQEELKAKRKTVVPKGESIEEIFAARKSERNQAE